MGARGPQAGDPRLRPFHLEEVDIESDPALLRRYMERIPVVALDGEELFDLFVDAGDLVRRLRLE
jgi:hypothetical protein